MTITKKSFLLCTITFCSVSFAVSMQSDTKDDIRELAERLALLEHKFVQEQHRVHIPTYTQTSHGFINSREGNTIIRDLQYRLQILEDKLNQYEKHFDETKHCNNRIQSLENTVQELSNLVKKQTHCTKYIERLETILTDQHITVSESREEKLQKSATLPVDENEGKQDRNTNTEDNSVANDNKTSNTRYISSINSESNHQESNFIRKRLLLPILTTTTTKPSPTAYIIAFYAYLSATIPSISGQSILTFDVIKTNNGNGYHPSTGVFIAPETGVYVFTWTMREASDCTHSTQLMVNATEIGIIRLQSVTGGDFVGTGVVVTHVNAGDDVYVRTHASWNNCHIASDVAARSSFAGWKLS